MNLRYGNDNYGANMLRNRECDAGDRSVHNEQADLHNDRSYVGA